MWARSIVLGSDSMNASDNASKRDYASWVRNGLLSTRRSSHYCNLVTDGESFGMGDWAGPQSLGLSCDSGSRYPLELKRKLLEKWADHVEGLVTPAGVRRVG